MGFKVQEDTLRIPSSKRVSTTEGGEEVRGCDTGRERRRERGRRKVL